MEKGACGLVILYLRILELKIDLSHKDSDHALSDVFSKSLTNANSSSTEEGSESHRVSSLSRGCQEIFVIAWIKPLWDVLLWVNPLVRPMVEVTNVYDNLLVFQNLLPCKLYGIRYLVDCRNSDAWVDSHSLINAVAQVVAVTQ